MLAAGIDPSWRYGSPPGDVCSGKEPANESEKPLGLDKRFWRLSLIANGFVCCRDMFSEKQNVAPDSETDVLPNPSSTPL
jgi:hypothetical protein